MPARAHRENIQNVGLWFAPITSPLDNLFHGPAKQVFSMDTNVHPAFGVQPKIQRNTKLVASVFRYDAGVMLIGDRIQETLSDPLHRQPRGILQRYRENSGGLGIDRARIRPAAPAQVTWKNRYWRMQKPPYRSPIGPFTHGQLPQQSILQRARAWMSGGNTQQYG